MRKAEARRAVALEPEAALELWTDLRRWPTFVEGFARVLDVSDSWPQEGSKLVWESIPAGRGRVTERVTRQERRGLTTEVFDESLHGTQIVRFDPAEEGAVAVVELEYELAQKGPGRWLADVLFIRRALRDSLRRTVGRFAVEAEEEAGLR